MILRQRDGVADQKWVVPKQNHTAGLQQNLGPGPKHAEAKTTKGYS
jgi:hypothetical protein